MDIGQDMTEQERKNILFYLVSFNLVKALQICNKIGTFFCIHESIMKNKTAPGLYEVTETEVVGIS